MDAGEQRLFCQLAIFVGGWTLEAAEAVCADALEEHGAPHQTQILNGLDSLLSKSLIRQSGAANEPRFSMLETIHEFALEQLDEHAEIATLRHRHAAFFLSLAERAEPHLTGRDQRAWFAQLALEQGNLRATLDWLLDGKHSARPTEQVVAAQVEDGLRLAGSLWRFWWMRGQLREGRTWLERAIDRLVACRSLIFMRRQLMCPGGAQPGAPPGLTKRNPALGLRF